MSSIWGEISCTLEGDFGTIDLEHTLLEPNFFKPRVIIHESKVAENGQRTYSRDDSYCEFLITEYINKYPDANSKADELLSIEDEVVLFTPGSIMWSRYCYVALVDIVPISLPWLYEIAYIKMIAFNNAVLGDYIRLLNGNILTAKDGTKLRKKIKGIE